MLRYYYLLSLLIFVNIGFCYDYTFDKSSDTRLISRKLKADLRHRRKNAEHGRHRKRSDYDVAYDKEPLAQIDVASFINSEEDESFSETDPDNFQDKNVRYGKEYDYGNLNDRKFDDSEAYKDSEVENIPNHLTHLQADSSLVNHKINTENTHGSNIRKNNFDNDFFTQDTSHHQQKKCALKNIKLPFFSHDKTAAEKSKKDKKRKLYGFNFHKKQSSKVSTESLPNQYKTQAHVSQKRDDTIGKRSYIERVCPVCKRKFIASKSLGQKYERRLTKNIKLFGSKYNKNDEKETTYSNKLYANADGSIPHDGTNFGDFWRRKREGDDRNIERQRELENLEKRVESVITNPHLSNNVVHNKL